MRQENKLAKICVNPNILRLIRTLRDREKVQIGLEFGAFGT